MCWQLQSRSEHSFALGVIAKVFLRPEDDNKRNLHLDSSTNAPSFLPAKQKALFMRIRQKGDLTPNQSPQKSKWDVGKGKETDVITHLCAHS